MDKKRIGVITKLTLTNQRFGFISSEGERTGARSGRRRDFFFHERNLAEAYSGAFMEMFEGQTVQFRLEEGPKGPFAQDVEFLESSNGEEREIVLSTAPAIIQGVTVCNAELMRFVQKHPEVLDQVHPGVFEEIVAKIFQNEGFETEQISSWNQADGGVDLIAIRKLDSQYPIRCAIQCKRVSHHRRVSAEPIRSLAGVLDRFQAHVGVVATTTYFTRPARDEVGRYLWRIDLRDYDNIVASLRKFNLL